MVAQSLSLRFSKFLILVAALVGARTAKADAVITIDGLANDWSATTTCEPVTGGLGSSGVLTKMCVENNKTGSATTPPHYLYALMTFNPLNPPSGYLWWGVVVDTNQDGNITDADKIFAVNYNNFVTSNAASLQVYSAINHTSLGNYTTTSNCGGNTTNGNGWNATLNTLTGVQEMRIAYGCLGMTDDDDTRYIALGASSSFLTQTSYYESYPYYYSGRDSSLASAATPTNALLFTAVAGNGQNTLKWTNSSQHEGVVIVRGTSSAPATAPTAHVAYDAGTVLSTSSKVIYADQSPTTSSSFVDTGLTNGTSYFYKIYNHWQNHTYANGLVPGSNGIFSTPTTRAATQALWCYSEGLPIAAQPVSARNVGVYSAGNLGAVTANATSATASADGQELWRPVALTGAVQNRFPVVPLQNKTGNYILTGDQNGKTYAISTSTGTTLWTGPNLDAGIQGQPGVQLYAYADTAFQTAQPQRDLVFFGSYDATSKTANKVVALNSQDGGQIWRYQPGNLDIINGGMLVDYNNDRLWVASRSNNNTQPSLRVLSSLDGGSLNSYSLGDIDYGTNLDFGTNQAITITNAGKVYAYDIDTMNQVWTYQVDAGTGVNSAPTSYAYPVDDSTQGSGFIVSLKGGQVQRYRVMTPNDAGTAFQRLWTVPVPNPSGIAIYYPQYIYVGGSDGKLYQIDANDGGYTSLSVSSQALGMPSVDTAAGRVAVGGLDGRLCSYAVPF